MKTSTHMIVTVLAFAVLGTVAAGSYWLGARSPARDAASATATATGATPAKPQRKLLYYRNPMGLADTSPTPKKDPMGMGLHAATSAPMWPMRARRWPSK